MATWAKPSRLFFSEPEKITSWDLFPRKDFKLCSPKTQRRASTMLLLPAPLGPTIQAMPQVPVAGLQPGKVSVVFWANDLKPWISIFSKNIDNVSSGADGTRNIIILAGPGLKNNTGLPKKSVSVRLIIDWYFENFSKKTNRRRCFPMRKHAVVYLLGIMSLAFLFLIE